MRRRRTRKWTYSETKFIMENFHKYSARQLGEKLGRSHKSVLRKLEELRKKGLMEPLDADDVKARTRMARTVEDDSVLDEGFDGGKSDFVYEEV